MFYTLFIGIALAVAVFFFAEGVGEGYIKNNYLSDEARAGREDGYLLELQAYVNENKLESKDTSELAHWVGDKGYLYVMIYKDDKLVLDSGSMGDLPKTDTEGELSSGENAGEGEGTEGGSTNETGGSGFTVAFPNKEELIEYAKAKGTYPIEMNDGVPLLVSLVDYTEYFYYDLINIISLILAAITLMVIIMLHSSRVTSRITKLARQVEAVAAGDMNNTIKNDRRAGRDEITDLASNVENMRCSMLENIAKEREAINSNTELITSMSHDIRTPLTVLLGYIDVMKNHTSDENMREYLDASESCALRLKTMSDDMFNYFVVFGEGESECDFEEYDAATLFEQILSEKILLLREQGYTVDIPMLGTLHRKLPGVRLSTDAQKLMRIAENVFSNITKYADKSYPVSITSKLIGDEITVNIVNKALQNANKVESNGIGLKTCVKLSEMLNLGFSAARDGDNYRVTIVFQVKVRIENESIV